MRRRVALVGVIVWLTGLFNVSSSKASADVSDHIFVKSDDFDGEAARHFADLVAAGRVEDAIAAGKHAPGGLDTFGRDGASAVEIAVEHNDKAMLAALLKAGANPNGAPEAAPLFLACNYDDLTMARMLLEAGADPNGHSGGESVLSHAAVLGARDAVTLLLGKGASVDKTDSVGKTALMNAGLADNWLTVELLLDHGASIWSDASNGATIASIAARSRVLPNHPDGAALPKVVERLKALGSAWPPPLAPEVKRLREAGQWPPPGRR